MSRAFPFQSPVPPPNRRQIIINSYRAPSPHRNAAGEGREGGGETTGRAGGAASRECVRTRIMAWRSTRDKRYRRAPVSRYAPRTRGPGRARDPIYERGLFPFPPSLPLSLSLSLSLSFPPAGVARRSKAIGSRGSITVVKSARADIAHVHRLIP
jgi:hypothetical protein